MAGKKKRRLNRHRRRKSDGTFDFMPRQEKRQHIVKRMLDLADISVNKMLERSRKGK